MKRYTMNKGLLVLSLLLLVASVGYTAAIMMVDVQAIGPEGSQVGLASINAAVFALAGSGQGSLAELADKLGDVLLLSAIGIIGLWALVGVVQLVRGKSLAAVSRPIIFLIVGCAIATVIYVVFNVVEVNYRPVLEDGMLEASFPSSHVLLATVVFGMTIPALSDVIENRGLVVIASILCVIAFLAMAALRVLAGAHWFTDVTAALLFGLTIVCLCAALASRRELRGRHAR